MSSPTILAVESSTKACSVSLLHQGLYYSLYEVAPQQHANLMLIMVESVLQKAGIKGGRVDALALCDGPGAFTGVRIAAGVIQGLAYGWQCPVVTVSSLEALAFQAYEETGCEQLVACLDARMQEMYLQECQVSEGILSSDSPLMLSESEAKNRILSNSAKVGVGDILPEFPSITTLLPIWIEAYPHAEAVVKIALQRVSEGKLVQDEVPLPLYLRNNVAIKKKV